MSSKIPFRDEMKFEYGVLEEVAPGVRRIVANNPSAFTFFGTGTYVVGSGEVAVIDPGPLDEKHISGLIAGLKGEKISQILITHTHQDHSPGAEPLKKITGAETFAFGPHGFGKQLMGVDIQEGGDMQFQPDHLIEDGQVLKGKDWSITCVYTPGHASNHMAFALNEGEILFSGDHVMGWSTSIVSPPDGDMASYMESLDKLKARSDKVYWPTHGPSIEEPLHYVDALIEHRLEREEQIVSCIEGGIHKISEMVPEMYSGTPKHMHPAAERSVLASMANLLKKGRVFCEEGEGIRGVYKMVLPS